MPIGVHQKGKRPNTKAEQDHKETKTHPILGGGMVEKSASRKRGRSHLGAGKSQVGLLLKKFQASWHGKSLLWPLGLDRNLGRRWVIGGLRYA